MKSSSNDEKKKRRISCVKCGRLRKSKHFSKERLRKAGDAGTCRQCVYTHYIKKKRSELSEDDKMLRRIGAQLAKRERAHGVRPFGEPSLDKVRDAVVRRFDRVSALSGKQLALADCCLTRLDLAKPFDFTSNACLLSTTESRSRSRLASDAPKDKGHADALAALQRAIESQ